MNTPEPMFEVIADQRSESDLRSILEREALDICGIIPADMDADDLLELINENTHESVQYGYHPFESGTVVMAEPAWWTQAEYMERMDAEN